MNAARCTNYTKPNSEWGDVMHARFPDSRTRFREIHRADLKNGRRKKKGKPKKPLAKVHQQAVHGIIGGSTRDRKGVALIFWVGGVCN